MPIPCKLPSYWIAALFGFVLFTFLRGAATEPVSSNLRVNSTSESNGNSDTREPHLRLISGLKDLSLISGDRVQLKCRVDAWPNDNLQYTWYKDSEIITADDEILIRNRPSGTKLTIGHLYTSDAGTYRCEVSNGELGVDSTAYLQVSFKSAPTFKPVIPSGKCEEYRGTACHSLLSGTQIYVDPFATQEEMEADLTSAFEHLNKESVSSNCRSHAFPAFCNFVFSPCEHKLDSDGKSKAVPIKVCREDCELMKYDVCLNEYAKSKKDGFLKEIFETANCTTLPTTTPNMKCTKVGLPSVVDKSHRCYNKTGVEYRGTTSFTNTGQICNPWPTAMIYEHKELAGGHNYCRNPGGVMDAPWCFVSAHVKATCSLEECEVPSSGPNIIFIVVPCVAVFILMCIIIAIVTCRKRNQQNNSGTNKNEPKNLQSVAYSTKAKLPELQPTALRILTSIGDCHYGKVFKAQVLPNPHLTTQFPVVIKTLRDGYTPREMEDFQRELQVFSELQHPNVACLKAFVLQPQMHALVFEYTEGVDLHEYLAMHSPQSDIELAQKTAPNASVIEEKDFIRIAVQVANGMEYLTGKNYVHRDLSARNVLVCGNQEIKISNLGVVRDSYLSSYYRSPQGGQMLPIRWMAPESLHSWKFSDKSTVWSFGVLLWEMFSYGLQPYCGYSNHEVLDMVSARQLLACPDQCPAKVYSLMQECWAMQPEQRPSFKDLRAKLQGWDMSGSERMTSQLAHGIHRQLANVVREGSGQYPSPHSISGSSGTYNNSRSGSPPPPPRYSTSGAYPTAPLVVGPPMQLAPLSEMRYQSGVQHSMPPQIGQQYPSGYDPREQQYSASTARIIQLPQREKSFSKRPSSQCSRVSSSSSSSANDKCVSQKQPLLKSIIETQDDPRPKPKHDLEDKEEQHYKEPKLVVRTNPGGKDPHDNPGNLLQPQNTRFLDQDSSDRSSNSLKATSCDSGLPVEDMDNHPDATAPLIGRFPLRAQQGKSPSRGPVPKQFT